MKITIRQVGDTFEVNGKSPDELEGLEKKFFEEFLISVKLGYEIPKNETLTAENYVGEKL